MLVPVCLPTLEERREILRRKTQAKEPKGFFTLKDLSKLDLPPTSEDRLDRLPSDVWKPELFSAAAKNLQSNAKLTANLFYQGNLPALTKDARFKYRGEYEDVSARMAEGQKLVVAVVAEGERVIAYGIASVADGGSEVAIIDVDQFSTRFAGLEGVVRIGDQSFGVGVGHLVVDLLLPNLRRPIGVDATTSGYIFKSLGFTSYHDHNPCLLRLT